MQKMTWCQFGKGAIKTIAAMILKEERDRLTKRAEAAEREARAQDGMTTISKAADLLESYKQGAARLRFDLEAEANTLRAEIADLKLVRDVQNEKLEELRGRLREYWERIKEYSNEIAKSQKEQTELLGHVLTIAHEAGAIGDPLKFKPDDAPGNRILEAVKALSELLMREACL